MTPEKLVEDERYRLMIDRLPAGVIVHDAAGLIVFANTAAAEISGFGASEDLIGRPITDLLPPPYLRSLRSRLVDTAPADRVHERLRRADGSTVEVEVADLPYVEGGVICVQISVSDIEGRIQTESALAVSEQRLRLLVEQLPGSVWTADPDGRIVTWRGRLGLAPDCASPVGLTLFDAIGHRTDEITRAANDAALAGTGAWCEIEHDDHVLSIQVEPLRGVDGQIEGTVGLVADVTDVRREESLRRRTDRLDALARLAGGVAHEINNVLGAILAQAAAARSRPSQPMLLESSLDAILAAAQRGGVVTQNLLGFSRGGMYRRKAVSVDDLVLEAALRVQRSARTNVEVTLDIATPGLQVEGDPDQLRVALDAVCDNGLEATPRGGTLSVRVRAEQEGVSGEPTHALIEVRDTGPGFTPEALERGFEPYFSTRGREGRGLGLSMVYGVVRHHGGSVRLQNGSEGGAIVTVELPWARPRPAPAPTPTESLANEPPLGLVLAVDDDDMMRVAERRLLESVGYEVCEASDGPTALALYAARKSAIALVMLDLRMPEMGGDEVLRRLLVIDPSVRVVICTGYDRDRVTQELFDLGNVGFLQKPFTRASMVAELERVRRTAVKRKPRPN